jgi:hypothetical protein
LPKNDTGITDNNSTSVGLPQYNTKVSVKDMKKNFEPKK